MAQFNREASQTRVIAAQKNAPRRAARPDPSLRKERLLRMTTKLHHYPNLMTWQGLRHAQMRAQPWSGPTRARFRFLLRE
jgi:hypothetical protein